MASSQHDQGLSYVRDRARMTTARGAATRKRILSTTAELLAQVGYTTTNVELVCKGSGVARGSILHQFPTRLDLMAGVLEYAADVIVVTMQQYIARAPDPVAELHNFCQLAWTVSRSRIAVALAEIQNAAHWDEGLAKLIRPASESLWQRFSAEFSTLAQRAGISRPDSLLPSLMLLTSGLRGLAIASRVSATQGVVQAALAQQQSIWRHTIESARKSSAPRAPPKKVARRK